MMRNSRYAIARRRRDLMRDAKYLTLLVAAACTGGIGGKVEGTAPAQAVTTVVTPATRTRIDETLSRMVQAGSIAGVSALIYEKDKEAYFNAFGMADREAARPMRRDAIVQIFSMTKPITGVALMTLYEQGKFKLDDPVAKYAPEFANLRVYDGVDANGQPKVVMPIRPVT